MERGLVYCMHAVAIAVVAYALMIYLLKQEPMMAEDRSVLLGAVVLIYMVMFGHNMPGVVNANIYKQ